MGKASRKRTTKKAEAPPGAGGAEEFGEGLAPVSSSLTKEEGIEELHARITRKMSENKLRLEAAEERMKEELKQVCTSASLPAQPTCLPAQPGVPTWSGPVLSAQPARLFAHAL